MLSGKGLDKRGEAKEEQPKEVKGKKNKDEIDNVIRKVIMKKEATDSYQMMKLVMFMKVARKKKNHNSRGGDGEGKKNPKGVRGTSKWLEGT